MEEDIRVTIIIPKDIALACGRMADRERRRTRDQIVWILEKYLEQHGELIDGKLVGSPKEQRS